MVMKATPKKPLLLKDYLLDELSSCSSSGFRAYPRRRACTTVRFLLEIDMMKSKQAMFKKKKKKKLIINNKNETIHSPISSTATLSSSLQKASGAVISAVKRFSLTLLIKSTRTTKIAALPRSLSRKLLRKPFWKKNDHDQIIINCCSSQIDSNSNITSEFINKKKKSDDNRSMLESDYTIPTLDDCSNDVVSGSNSRRRSRRRVGVTTPVRDDCDATTSTNSSTSTTNNYSTNNSKKALTNEVEKEQCSPVSVLDCPFDDEDEISSSFRHGAQTVEGAEEKPMKKIHRSDQPHSHLEPLILENRLALADEENEKPLKLLELIKATMPSSSCGSETKADNLLLDFFKERISYGDYGVCIEILKAAEDWINGRNCEFSVEWEVQKNREAFIQDMEKSGEWKTLLGDGKNQVAFEVEAEVFASLLNELLDDPCSWFENYLRKELCRQL